MSESLTTTGRIPQATTLDGLRLALFHILPTYLQGLFTRNRFWVTVFQTLHTDPLAVRFLTRLKRKYKADGVLFNLGGTPTLLVFNVDIVRRVLDRSPEPSRARAATRPSAFLS